MFRRCASRLGVQKLHEPMVMPDVHTQIRGQRTFAALKKDQIARGAIAAISIVWALAVVLRHGKTRKIEKKLKEQ